MVRVLFVVALLTLLSSCASAFPTARWVQKNRVRPDEELTLTIGLKQNNGDKLFDELMAVSDPRSKTYGQHWSHEEIVEYTRPAPESRASVAHWLASSGIDVDTADWTVGGEWLSVKVKVSQAERLLQTQYHEYTHKETGKTIVRSTDYFVPEEVKQHIDIIGPTTRFPRVTSKPLKTLVSKKNTQHRHVRSKAAPDCSQGSTPDCIRGLYSVGDAAATSGQATVTVTGYLEQYISLDDLASFYKQFDTNSTGRVPTIVGPNDPTNPGVEASLDIQYVSALAHGSNFSFVYTAGRSPKNPENEPFLAFAQSLANQTTVPWVISTSYGDDEDTVDYDYAVRMDQEFSKLGIRGVSILFSSGDSGVGCNDQQDKFMPTLPATLPSVTAVGATGYDGKTESGSFFSSGGFANFFPIPSYQASAVSNYLKTYSSSLPKASFYNATGRAFPDVAALGEDFPIVVQGNVIQVDGTSCSSPTFAGILSTLNDIRLGAGKSPLGFLNPLIYQHPEIFNDITSGSNPACGTQGFPAEKGWDPVTGLGTPNYPVFAKLVGSL